MTDKSDVSQRAEVLKGKANNLYASGGFKEAAKLYDQAFRLSPKPVYLSNLSAAQYELGAYKESLSTITKALTLVDYTADLAAWSKLSIRSIKCHFQLKDWESALEEIADILLTDVSTETKDTVVDLLALIKQSKESSSSYAQDEARWRKAIVELPRYRPDPNTKLEFFATGHDRACSIMTAQELDGPVDVIEEPRMRMAIPSDERPFEFSALFGGIGDARHFFATLWDIGNQLEARRDKPLSALKMHFSLLDIHPTALARDLIVLHSLDELAKMDDSDFKSSRARLILNMLHFLYWCTAMPPSLYDCMLEKIRAVRDNFAAAAATASPVTYGWLCIGPQSVTPIMTSLNWWLGGGPKSYSVTQVLPTSVERHNKCPFGCIPEQSLFDDVKILWPALDVDEPDNFKKAIQLFPKVFKNGAADPLASARLKRSIVETINARVKTSWKPNITYIDRNWQTDRGHNPFQEMSGIILSRHLQHYLPKRATRLSDYSDVLFSHTARAIRRLLHVGSDALTTELLVGDVWKIAESISMGTLERAGFPKLFDRIHLSNVPDYTGGHGLMLPLAFPLLKGHTQAYCAANCLLNTGLFGQLGPGGNPLECVDAYVYQYAATTRGRLPHVYGVEAVNEAIYLGRYTTYVPSMPSSPPTVNRDELITILYGMLMRCVLPARFEKAYIFMTPREPLTIHALFRLIRVLGRLHSAHILADFVASIVENKAVTTVELHEYCPIPVPKRPSTRKHNINCLALQAEFEVACAIWAPLLSFPLRCKIPRLADIATYSINFTTLDPSLLRELSGDKMALILLVGKQEELEDCSDIRRLRRQVWEGTNATNSISLISSFQWSSDSETAHVLLTQSRFSSFIQRGLFCALVNTVFWHIMSSVEPCRRMRLTGDVHNQIPEVTLDEPVGSTHHLGCMESWFGPLS